MGAYNELIIEGERGEEIVVQFKYGIRFQYQYRLGDEIEFDGSAPSSEIDVPGIAFDRKMKCWKYFSVRFNGRKIERYQELSEAQYNQKFPR